MSQKNPAKNEVGHLNGISRVVTGDDLIKNSGGSISIDTNEVKVVATDINDTKLNHSKATLPPLNPTCVLGIGLNYKRHADEIGKDYPKNPIVFMKNVSSITGSGNENPIVIPKICQNPEEVDYECELAVIIGKPCKDVSVDDALNYVFGYTIANDVSARKWQGARMGNQWVFGKSFDTFCPLGPQIVLAKDIPDPQALRMRTILNGEVKQDSSTADMIFSVAECIAFASQSTTLVPGTVILTGTPDGVGMNLSPQRYLKDGDIVTCEIEGIGSLTNSVVYQK
jgi:2-keto-4-pentenoate hydratase/2-oxohepta-3-ene-1,7-dioic acid hydratase in catechol pathway